MALSHEEALVPDACTEEEREAGSLIKSQFYFRQAIRYLLLHLVLALTKQVKLTTGDSTWSLSVRFLYSRFKHIYT